MILLDLFIGFLEVGIFSFGGGYAAIPLIREVVLSHNWMDDAGLTHMIAVSESTPGPLMVNLATYVGSVQGGIPGAIVATAAVVFPAFLFIVLVLSVCGRLIKSRYFQAMLGGMKPCITGIILATGIYMVIQNCFPEGITGFDIKAGLITILLGTIYFASRKFIKKGITPIQFIIISAVAGILFYGT